MEVSFNLEDALGGEGSLQELVQESIESIVSKGIGKKIDEEISLAIKTAIDNALVDKMPAIINDIMNAEYVQVDRWGTRQDKPTNFRQELVKSINENMQYKKTSYSSERNFFTKAVDDVVEESVASFKSEFSKAVDAVFVKEAMEFAQKKLAERLGLPK